MTTIADLNAAFPGTNGNAGLGDDYLRETRNALSTCFGAVDGPVEAGSGNGLATDVQLTALFDRLDAIESVIGGALTVGMVVFWPETLGTIPTGWAWCDGSVANGYLTPDLQDLHIVCAGGSHAPGFNYGSATTSSSGSVGAGVTGSHVLTAAELPDITSNLLVDVDTFNSGGDHDQSAVLAGSGGDINATTSAPFSTTGMNGDGHTHTIPAVAAHTHTVAPESLCMIPICYVGV